MQERQFGDIMKKLRLARGSRLKDVASKCGVSVSHISDMEHGRRGPGDMNKIQRIDEFLQANGSILLAAGERKQAEKQCPICLELERQNAELNQTIYHMNNRIQELEQEVKEWEKETDEWAADWL